MRRACLISTLTWAACSSGQAPPPITSTAPAVRAAPGSTGLVLYHVISEVPDHHIYWIDVATGARGVLEHETDSLPTAFPSTDGSWVWLSGFKQGDRHSAVRLERAGTDVTGRLVPGVVLAVSPHGTSAVVRCGEADFPPNCFATIGPGGFSKGAELLLEGAERDSQNYVIEGWLPEGELLTSTWDVPASGPPRRPALEMRTLQLQRYAPSGGRPVAVGDLGYTNGASPFLSNDGRTLAWGIHRDQHSGPESIRVAPLAELESAGRSFPAVPGHCAFAPGDRVLVCATRDHDADGRLVAIDLPTGAVKELLPAANYYLAFSPDGEAVALPREEITIVPLRAGSHRSLGVRGVPLAWIR